VSGRIVLRPQRTINIGRLLLAAAYLSVSFSFPDSQADQPERFEQAVLVFYAVFAGTGALVAARNWTVEAMMRIPLLLLDVIAFVILLMNTGGGSSPYKAAAILLLMVATLNVPKVAKPVIPLLVVAAYLLSISVGLNVQQNTENRYEEIALNVIHVLLLGGLIAIYLGGNWRRSVQEGARERLQASDLFEEGYSLPELAVAAGKRSAGANRAWLIMAKRDEGLSYYAEFGNRAMRADIDHAVTSALATLPPHTALLGGKDRGCRIMSQPPQRPYGPILGSLPAEMCSAMQQMGLSEAVVLPLQILETKAWLLLGFDEELSEAHMLRAAQSRRRIEGMISDYERRLSASAYSKQQERQAMWRNLHDTTLQSLAAIRFQLGQLKGTSAVKPVAQEKLELIDGIVADEVKRLRGLNWDAGDEESPLRRLEQTAAKLGRKWEIDCGFSHSAIDHTALENHADNGSTIAHNLAFAMEEIVANSVRHGGASQIAFKLSAADDIMLLSALGNGSSPELLPKSLSARVADLGGSLTIEPTTLGTRLQIVFQNRENENG
jgi:signal transduction histidine kinase